MMSFYCTKVTVKELLKRKSVSLSFSENEINTSSIKVKLQFMDYENYYDIKTSIICKDIITATVLDAIDILTDGTFKTNDKGIVFKILETVVTLPFDCLEE